MNRFVPVICVAACLLTLAGCRRAGRAAAEKAIAISIEKSGGGKAEVDLSGQNMTIKTKDGEFVTGTAGTVALPKEFPADVLVYKDAKVLMAMNTPEGSMVSLQTADAIDKVVQAYSTEMTSLGWTEEATVNAGGQTVLAYAKEERKAAISIAQADDATHITVNVEKPKK